MIRCFAGAVGFRTAWGYEVLDRRGLHLERLSVIGAESGRGFTVFGEGECSTELTLPKRLPSASHALLAIDTIGAKDPEPFLTLDRSLPRFRCRSTPSNSGRTTAKRRHRMFSQPSKGIGTRRTQCVARSKLLD